MIDPNDMDRYYWHPLVTSVSDPGGPSTLDLRGKLAIPTAKACVDIIAEAIGTMDIECLDEDGEQTDTPSYMEESMDGSPFMDTMISLQRSNLTYGNGYLAVGWSEAPGEEEYVRRLEMLHPTGCTPYIRKDGLTGLKVKTPANQDTILLEPSEFRHTYDARMPGDIKGASPLQVCDAAFKLADETIGHASAIMRNQSMPAAAITSPPEMDDEDMKKFQASWERRHKGPGNASKIAMLYAGQDLKTVQFSPADAELIKSREMSGRDITTAMRVPPFMVGDAGGATMWGTGVHKIFLGFSNVRLRAPRKRMEALLTSVVKLDKGTDAVRVKLRQDHLMYGDFKEKVETFMQLHGAGVLNDDELRAGLGFKPRGQR